VDYTRVGQLGKVCGALVRLVQGGLEKLVNPHRPKMGHGKTRIARMELGAKETGKSAFFRVLFSVLE
jgi:hypothetical protein